MTKLFRLKNAAHYIKNIENQSETLWLYIYVVLKLKQPYNCETALLALINFFVKKGLVVARNTEQLVIVDKDEEDKVFYSIARFIVEENKKGSSVFDYIIDISLSGSALSL